MDIKIFTAILYKNGQPDTSNILLIYIHRPAQESFP